MKHRIRQAAGDQSQAESNSGKSSSQQSATTTKTHVAAGGSNHVNNKNVNKIALNMQREHDFGGDYAVA